MYDDNGGNDAILPPKAPLINAGTPLELVDTPTVLLHPDPEKEVVDVFREWVMVLLLRDVGVVGGEDGLEVVVTCTDVEEAEAEAGIDVEAGGKGVAAAAVVVVDGEGGKEQKEDEEEEEEEDERVEDGVGREVTAIEGRCCR